MSTINYKEGNCEKYRRQPVTIRKTTFKKPAIEGASGANTYVWCAAFTMSANYFTAVKAAAGNKDKTYGHNYTPWSQLKLSTGKEGLEAKEAAATYSRTL